ncbi:MAG: efflux RND transporter periplasmic adaptor subunit [Rhodocyclaceae bacterium]|nr:efflux RND transporter periplasmic adaptor subunit [Rhodocyclaceae bacterium]
MQAKAPSTARPSASRWNIPLFSGYATTYKVRAAEAQAEAQAARREQVRLQVGLDVWNAYAALLTATQSVKSAADLLESATLSEAMAAGRYKAGVGSILDLLTAQTALATARQQRIQAGYNWYVARAALAQSMGALEGATLNEFGAGVPAHAPPASPPPAPSPHDAMNRTLKYTLLSIAALAALGAGYYALSLKEAAQPEKRYRFQEAAKGDLTQAVSANGTLNPVVLVNVGTQVSGTVRKLYVDFNAQVKAGQPLLEIDQSLLAAQARQSEAGLRSAEAALELAVASEQRMKSLLAQEYVSQQDYDAARQSLKSAQAAVAQARALRDKDGVNLGNTVIRSPVSGVVVDRQVDIGQTVAASFQTPTLFKIAQDLTEMQIHTTFAEADIGSIRVGQPVRFNVDAFPNRNFRGKVKQIRLNPTTQQNVVTYNVVVEVDNPDQLLLPGMTAYVSIAVAHRKDVLTVPNAALRFRPADAAKPAENGEAKVSPQGTANKDGKAQGKGDGKGKRDTSSGTIHVLEGGRLKPLVVQLGISDGRSTEIAGGELKAGDRIAVGEALPQADNKSGSPVRMRLF